MNTFNFTAATEQQLNALVSAFQKDYVSAWETNKTIEISNLTITVKSSHTKYWFNNIVTNVTGQAETKSPLSCDMGYFDCSTLHN